MEGWLTGCVFFDLEVTYLMWKDSNFVQLFVGLNCGSGPAEAWRFFCFGQDVLCVSKYPLPVQQTNETFL